MLIIKIQVNKKKRKLSNISMCFHCEFFSRFLSIYTCNNVKHTCECTHIYIWVIYFFLQNQDYIGYAVLYTTLLLV